MSSYIPPKKGTDPTPQTGKPAYGVRQEGPDAGTSEGLNLLGQHDAAINSWVSAQRQNVANSPTQVHNASLSHPDYDVRYQNIQGAERVSVRPKVQPTSSSSPDKPEPEQVSPPNKLPELVGDTDDHTSKCMMVLYTAIDTATGQEAGFVAAVDMTSLKNPSVTYQGLAKGSKWTQSRGRVLATMQATFGTKSFVMWPLDITGSDTAAKLYLSTTELGDAVKTQADPAAMPVINGTDQSVYTAGGAYRLDKTQGLLLTKGLHAEANGVVQIPHAIANDGTCYALPRLNGDINISSSYTTTPVFDPSQRSSETYSQVSAAANKVALAEATIGYAGVIQKTKTHATLDHQNTLNEDSTINTTGTVGQCRFTDKLKAVISAYSYYFSAVYGSALQLQNYVAAQGTTAAVDYTGGETGYVVTRASGVGNIVDNKFPLMSWTGGKSDLLSVNMAAYKGNQISTEDVTFDMSKKRVVMAGIAGGWSGEGHKNFTGANPFIDPSYNQDSYTVGGQVPNPPPSKEATDGDYEDAWAQARQFVTSNGGTIQDVSLTTLTLNIHEHYPNVSADGSGDGTDDSLDGSGAADWPTDILTAGVGWTAPGGDGAFNVYVNLHYPKSYPSASTRKGNSEVSFLGETLTSHYDDNVPDGNLVSIMNVHVFPPMYQSKPWYTLGTGAIGHLVYTTVTPYAKHDKVDQSNDAFHPWLHVSNGTHIIQGYYVMGEGYLFLDGSNQNYLPVLAKALGCDPGDICSMVMDVTLKKIKAVEGVKPPDYSGSAAGDPGVVAHG